MRMWIPVRAGLVRPLVVAVAAWHGVNERETDTAIQPEALAWRREVDGDLAEMVETLRAIEWDPLALPGEVACGVRLTAEREILSHAVLRLMRDAIARLDAACTNYPEGRCDVPEIEQLDRHLGELIGLFRQTELLAGGTVRER